MMTVVVLIGLTGAVWAQTASEPRTVSLMYVKGTDLDMGNGGTAGIHVTGTLNAILDDSADVTYAGSPTLGTIRLTHGATLSQQD